jgi:phage gp36-like protein
MYITSKQLEAYIQEQLLTQGLDDSGENILSEEKFAQVVSAVEMEVHSFLESRYEVPFKSNVPNTVTHACLVLSAEAIWKRRGISGDANPFNKDAGDVRSRLSDIRLGKAALSLLQVAAPTQDAGAIISEPSLIAGSGRLTL